MGGQVKLAEPREKESRASQFPAAFPPHQKPRCCVARSLSFDRLSFDSVLSSFPPLSRLVAIDYLLGAVIFLSQWSTTLCRRKNVRATIKETFCHGDTCIKSE